MGFDFKGVHVKFRKLFTGDMFESPTRMENREILFTGAYTHPRKNIFLFNFVYSFDPYPDKI
jgi:hypothetical protein